MTLAIASGKGGTGKTTLAVNLAASLGAPVQVLDCDVEEPNAGLFLRGTVVNREDVCAMIPVVDAALCDSCGECARFCAFNAIAATPRTKAAVFTELCHACGGCALVCPRKAISETGRKVGEVETREIAFGRLVTGRMEVGLPMAPPVIRAVRDAADKSLPVIIDASPGTACPVVAALKGADRALLVTEPTPFGLNDLTLAVELARVMGIPFGVVINRAGSGDGRVADYCRAEGIAVMLEIPDDRRIAEAVSRGDLVVEAVPEYRPLFAGLAEELLAPARGGAS